MHFITLLYDRTLRRYPTAPNVMLRGNNPLTWVAPELHDVQLPVNAIAYASCPTSRDIYWEAVQGKSRPATWSRYQGRVIDEVYKNIHQICRQYTSNCRARNCDLYAHLTSQQDSIISQAKSKFRADFKAITSKPQGTEIQEFDAALRKITKFEAEITSSLVNFEIARLRSANPRRIFDEFFDFNTDFALTAKHQGFGETSVPDFIFRNAIIGDIKMGTWHDFFVNTVVAYALAYEEHTGRPMNFGAILHVELSLSRLVPTHYRASIEPLDDYRRKRFLAIRDRKLQIVKEGKDPGIPDNKERCDLECPFIRDCWGGEND
jgi:CRISPR/Cas system-associated exonuclease Cas4 (RecB family)